MRALIIMTALFMLAASADALCIVNKMEQEIYAGWKCGQPGFCSHSYKVQPEEKQCFKIDKNDKISIGTAFPNETNKGIRYYYKMDLISGVPDNTTATVMMKNNARVMEWEVPGTGQHASKKLKN